MTETSSRGCSDPLVLRYFSVSCVDESISQRSRSESSLGLLMMVEQVDGLNLIFLSDIQ